MIISVKSESPNQQSTSSSASVKGEEFNLENGRTTSASEVDICFNFYLIYLV